MTVKQAGHLGGETTAEEFHGTGFYKNIGHKGGVAAAKNQGKGQFAKGSKQNTPSKSEVMDEEKAHRSRSLIAATEVAGVLCFG